MEAPPQDLVTRLEAIAGSEHWIALVSIGGSLVGAALAVGIAELRVRRAIRRAEDEHERALLLLKLQELQALESDLTARLVFFDSWLAVLADTDREEAPDGRRS